jgi:hypothetical protein
VSFPPPPRKSIEQSAASPAPQPPPPRKKVAPATEAANPALPPRKANTGLMDQDGEHDLQDWEPLKPQ